MSLLSRIPRGEEGRVGTATARIVFAFDQSVKSALVSAARDMGRSLDQNIGGGAQKGVKEAESSIKGLEGTLSGLAKSMAGAFAIGSMVKITTNVQRLTQLFKVLTGSEEAAAEELAKLRDLADKTGQPYLKLVEGATALLPATRKANVDLAQTLSIAQRLAILDPMQGIEGAAFAIHELLSGEYLSLSRRFEMSRSELQALVQAAGDDTQSVIDGLDQMVNEMGLTDEAMMDMGKSGMYAFEQLKSEIQETVAMGFAPMLQNGVLPLVSGFSDLISEARRLNPELTELTMTMLGFAAASKAAQMSGIPGGGKVGALIGAGALAYGGTQIGVAASRGLAEAGVIERPDLENISQAEGMSKFVDTLKMAVVGAADTVLKFAAIVALGIRTLENVWNQAKMVVSTGVQGLYVGFLETKDGLYDFRDTLIDDIIPSLKEGLAGFLTGIAEFVDDIPGLGKVAEQLKDAAGSLVPTQGSGAISQALFGNVPGWQAPKREKTPAQIRREQDEARQAEIDAAREAMSEYWKMAKEMPTIITEEQTAAIMENYEELRQKILGLLSETAKTEEELAEERLASAKELAESIQSGMDAFADSLSFSDEQIAAFAEFQDELAQIEADAQQQREDALEQHEKAKTRAEEDFARKRQRDIEDETRRYQKAIANLESNIADERVNADARIAEIQEQFQQEEVQRAEDYARERRQRLLDLARGIAEAARKLDASAIWDLMQRNRDEAATNKEAYDLETAERQRERDEAVQQTRQDSAARIAAMREDFAAQEAQRAEERDIRLQRENEDFALQMQNLDAQHAERMQKIDQQAREQTAKLEAAFINTYNQMAMDAGQHQSRMIDIQRQGQNVIEQQFAAWLSRMQGQVASATSYITPGVDYGGAGAAAEKVRSAFGFDTGGRVPRSGIYKLMRGEQVLTPDTAALMRNVMGGEITSPALRQMAMSGGSRSISTGDISIPISITEPGASADQIGAIVEFRIRKIFEDFVNE